MSKEAEALVNNDTYGNSLQPDVKIKSRDVTTSINEISGLTKMMGKRMAEAVREIDQINLQTRLLSFNAQVEASRAGTAGRAFGVVAKEMVDLATRTSSAASRLDIETKTDIRHLTEITATIGTLIRGSRLTDLAFSHIDLIDRNLYERSCDVRWWATDAACVEACVDLDKTNFATQRLGVILDSYTVYFDIVICDINGKVIANGRPGKYATLGSSQAHADWFKSAMATKDGTEFGFQGAHRSTSLAGNQMVLVYSAAIRRDGRVNGEPIGVLGVVFNWEALAQTIMLNVHLGEEERKHTRVCIADKNGEIVADNLGKHLQDRFNLNDIADLVQKKKGFENINLGGETYIVAYSRSHGFETYATGWHSLLLQKLNF